MKRIVKKSGEGEASKQGINRREFMKLSTFAGAGLLLVIGSDSRLAKASPIASFEPHVYLKITNDGKTILFAKNPEIGQGVKTSMPQVIAEELEVDWTQIEVQQGMLDGRFGPQFAGGSSAIKENFEVLRKAGASAREMLIDAAANNWSVSRDRCYAENGAVWRKDTKAKLTYAELAEDASKLTLPDNPPLKDPKDFKIIGRPVSGVDNFKIATGKTEFGLDARPAGMRVAIIERCPVYGGRVKSVDDSAALGIDGVEQIIRIEPTENATQLVAGVAVIAKNTWAAMKGRKALKVTWDFTGLDPESDEKLKARFEQNINATSNPIRDDGNVDEVFGQCEKMAEAVYEVPFLAHATMEPMNYIADVKPDRVDLWGPTQVPGNAMGMAMSIAGVSPQNIKVRMTRVGGGFGRRLMADYACEAIYLSKAIGKPVQVVWTREDDIRHDFFRPAGMYKLKGGLDKNNKLVAWHLSASTTSRYAFAGSMNPPYMTEVFPDGFPAGFVPNFRMQYLPAESKVPRGAWRGPGHNATAWIDQCFLDEMAVLAGKDPVDFRLELLGEEDKMMPYRDHGGPSYRTRRLRNVIRLAAEKSSWYSPAGNGMFRGFASHFMFGAYVAEVVSVSFSGGKIKLEKAIAVVDCGLVINKSGAMNQLEGGIIDGLSMAMHQGIHIENGLAKEKNFNDYRLLRMNEAPEVEVHIVDSNESPEGLGEMSLPPVAAALCNAIYRATGKRIRKLPISVNEAVGL